MSPQDARRASTFDHATILRSNLKWGADKAQSIGELAERLDLSRRQVEVALQKLSTSGAYPIIAGPRGVYLSDSADEIDAYADALRARLEHQAARIKGLRDCARRMRGKPKQETLPWAA